MCVYKDSATCNKMDRSMSEMMYRNNVLYKIASLEDLLYFLLFLA